VDAQLWKEAQIKSWLDQIKSEKIPAVVIMSEGRHPMLKGSPWWPILRSTSGARIYSAHRFQIFFVP
jgi:hypothetical protein